MESKKRKLNKGKFVRTLLVATLAIYFCVVFIKQEIDIAQLRNNAKAIEVKIQQATQEKNEINEQLQKENYYKRVEDIARDKLGFLKNNEILFVDSAEK
ncbi:MAG: septum formation initiator family protein [Clostridia bacterium]|nr:septum formation initiator family protein [Clostridia bacterium]